LSRLPSKHLYGKAPTKLSAYLNKKLPKEEWDMKQKYYSTGDFNIGITSIPTIAWKFGLESLGDFYRWCNVNKKLPIHSNRSLYLKELELASKYVSDKKYIFDYCSYLREQKLQPSEESYLKFCNLLKNLWDKIQENPEKEEKNFKYGAACDYQSLQEWMQEVIDSLDLDNN